ncbi:hypothetical protein [Sorangium sp. So ce117]|uniref:hypothetical protein n=1 Tax=Sorangium sp. So ce117 TaxID=3133277 RepID=UPI003F616164
MLKMTEHVIRRVKRERLGEVDEPFGIVRRQLFPAILLATKRLQPSSDPPPGGGVG